MRKLQADAVVESAGFGQAAVLFGEAAEEVERGAGAGIGGVALDLFTEQFDAVRRAADVGIPGDPPVGRGEGAVGRKGVRSGAEQRGVFLALIGHDVTIAGGQQRLETPGGLRVTLRQQVRGLGHHGIVPGLLRRFGQEI